MAFPMKELKDEIEELRRRAESNRRAFLRADLRSCEIAVDKGQYELERGKTDEAEKEFAMAQRGVEIIANILSDAQQSLPEVETGLAALKRSLLSLRANIDAV